MPFQKRVGVDGLVIENIVDFLGSVQLDRVSRDH